MTVPNEKLITILDEEDDRMMDAVADGGDVDEDELHAEHMKRVQAEAEARNNLQKLQVAQQQWAEYIQSKASEEHELAEQAHALEGVLSSLLKIGGENAEQALAGAQRLKEALAAAAMEANLTAAQVQAETDRVVKRTSSQANLDSREHASEKDVEMKRARDDDLDNVADEIDDDVPAQVVNGNGMSADMAHDTFRERAKYIPLRLTHEERRLLRLLEAALDVSEYTDKVDVLSYRSKNGRVHAQIKDLCAILCGLTVAQNFRRGQSLLAERNFEDLSEFFQDCFEVGRRHKVMNPEKMRGTYGKLMYMLMDSVEPEISELLGFRCVRDLRTVYNVLEEGGALGMLEDPLVATATAEIVARNRPRAAVQRDIKSKERARDTLARKYRTKTLGEEDLLSCLYSIADNNSFLTFARDPVDRMIDYLKQYFSPESAEPGLSLAIHSGAGGARLTHSHSRQYTYVLQSLTLWREIAHEMFKLWCLAEGDMTSQRNRYRLQNTGQGLQRVQAAPAVGRAMAAILARCQHRIGSWVGSSVVHLGDHNVPNALMFIDKYTQVPRILNPVVLVLDELPHLAKDPGIAAFLESSFGGVNACCKEILADFFRHAFDGSGADSFFDAGSCIDGRLTSAWNWCSKVEKKRYYSVFKLAGFTGFDGDFKG